MLKCLPKYNFTFNPFIRYLSRNIGEFSGVNILKREVPIIVSLSSVEEHFGDLELSLYAIFNQSVQADKIILWLSDEYELAELPYSITRYIKNGLEIRFVEDKGVYNGIIYALKEFESSIIVYAKDDIIYPKDWLKKLYHSYIANPEDIHLHKTLRTIVNKNSTDLASVKEWIRFVTEEDSEFSNFILSEGGVLIPPKCFTKEVFREDIYKKNSPTSVDIWLWFMALVSGRKIRVVKNHINTLTCTNIFRKLFGYDYKKNIKRYDEQIENLMNFYKQNIMQKLS